jgi:enoyl-CoA hydratase
MSQPEAYKGFSAFKADRPHPGVLRLWIDTGHPNNAVTHENHAEFGDVWKAVAAEEDVRAVLVRGVDGVFCGGGDMSFLPPLVESHETRMAVHHDIRALVMNMIDCPKPIVSAIDGMCSGAGLAVGIMADVAVAAESASLWDAHVMYGLVCGDHAAMAWPLKMGMAKAKYHLLTATAVTGKEAERNGLVALSVADAELQQAAMDVAIALTKLPAEAVSLTKQSLNGWYRLGQPIFEQSAALEALGFAGDTVRELVKSQEG